MLRIHHTREPGGRVILRAEGRVAGAWARELDRECRRLLNEGHRVALDFSEVVFVDRSGAEVVRQLRSADVQFVHVSPVLRDLLDG